MRLPPGRRDAWLAVALFAAGFLLLFRRWLLSGFDATFGDLEDGYIALAIIEHWRHVLTGAVHWSDPAFFHPHRGVLGFTDAFFLLGLASAPLRMLGFDPFTTHMLVVAALAAIGFFGFRRLAMRHFGLPGVPAAVGAFLFAFANVDSVKLIHVQAYCAMLLPPLCDLALTAWAAKRRGALLGAAAGVLYGALFLTAFQTAWFFGCFVVLVALLHPAVCGLAATRALVRAMATRKTVLIAMAAGFAVSIVPFCILYVPVFMAGHSRSFAEVGSNLPHWRDLANVTPHNALWGALLERLAIVGRPGRPMWEAELAFTPVVSGVFVAGLVMLARRAGRAAADSFLLVFGAAVVVFWLLQMDYGGVRPWRAIWALVPGGGAVRYPFRMQLVANMAVCLVAARMLAGLEVRRAATVALCAVLVAEQVNLVWPATLSRREALAWIEAVPPPPAGCRAFYLAPGGVTGGAIPEQRQAAAMLFAEIRGIPTVNGASSWHPEGWALRDPQAPGYPEAVRTWARRTGVEGLCALALPAGEWTWGGP